MITKSCLNFTAIAAAFIFFIYTVDDASALGREGARGGGSELYAVGGQHTVGSQAYGGQPYASGIKVARKGRGGKGGGRGGARAGKSHHGGAKRGGGGYSRGGSASKGNLASGRKPKKGRGGRGHAPRTGGGNQSVYIDNSDDGLSGGEVAAVALGSAAVGYMAGQSSAQNTTQADPVYASPSGNGGLPCNPNTAVKNEITYYQCGNNWYVQAYGESGVMYIPAQAPY